MRQPTGYVTIVDPDQPTVERDTVGCGHCQRIIDIKPATAATIYLILDRATFRYTEVPGAFCRICMRPICLACCDAGTCVPWEKMLERMEDRGRFLRQAGIDA